MPKYNDNFIFLYPGSYGTTGTVTPTGAAAATKVCTSTCAIGTYSLGTSAISVCPYCPFGTYAAATGSKSCLPCTTGYTSNILSGAASAVTFTTNGATSAACTGASVATAGTSSTATNCASGDLHNLHLIKYDFDHFIVAQDFTVLL